MYACEFATHVCDAVLCCAVLFCVQASAPYEIVSFTNCFHGRTMGALALTYKEQYKTPFLPVMPGHVLAEYNNLDSAAQVGGMPGGGVRLGYNPGGGANPGSKNLRGWRGNLRGVNV
jgi:hypothetical protein